MPKKQIERAYHTTEARHKACSESDLEKLLNADQSLLQRMRLHTLVLLPVGA